MNSERQAKLQYAHRAIANTIREYENRYMTTRNRNAFDDAMRTKVRHFLAIANSRDRQGLLAWIEEERMKKTQKRRRNAGSTGSSGSTGSTGSVGPPKTRRT